MTQTDGETLPVCEHAHEAPAIERVEHIEPQKLFDRLERKRLRQRNDLEGAPLIDRQAVEAVFEKFGETGRAGATTGLEPPELRGRVEHEGSIITSRKHKFPQEQRVTGRGDREPGTSRTVERSTQQITDDRHNGVWFELLQVQPVNGCLQKQFGDRARDLLAGSHRGDQKGAVDRDELIDKLRGNRIEMMSVIDRQNQPPVSGFGRQGFSCRLEKVGGLQVLVEVAEFGGWRQKVGQCPKRNSSGPGVG